MCDLVARTGRHQQRYKDGYRLVAGCIPFKYESWKENCDTKKKITKVLMISSQSGPGQLFPKRGWENDETVEEAAVREAIEEAGVRGDLKEYLGDYDFSSKGHQDEFSPEGLCKASMFSLYVKEELSSSSIRQAPKSVETALMARREHSQGGVAYNSRSRPEMPTPLDAKGLPYIPAIP